MIWFEVLQRYPGEGEVVCGRVRWRVDYIGSAPTSVAFLVDGVPVLDADDAQAPFEILLDTRQLADGPHALRAVGVRGTRSVATEVNVVVENPRPAIQVDVPIAVAA